MFPSNQHGLCHLEYDKLIKGEFIEYLFPHLDLMLRNIELGFNPIIYNEYLFDNQEVSSKGGYNLFEIFVNNYLTLLRVFVDKNLISNTTFDLEKNKLLYGFIFPWYKKIINDKSFTFETKKTNYYLLKFFKIKEVYNFNIKITKYKLKKNIKNMLKQILKTAKKIIFNKFVLRASKVIDNINRENDWQKIKILFKSVGDNVSIPVPYLIKNPQYISIGDNFSTLNNLRIEAWDEYYGEKFNPKIIIGDNVIMNSDVHIGCINKVIIGNNVLFASRIYISDHSHGEVSFDTLRLPPCERPLISKGPVIIEDNVWIGEGVAILPNVTIGKNCIIGANSVVTKSFPENSVIAGNPAKILRVLS